ncbi:hypothetical protein BAUCODRAFT_74127 [Baudoinia panamericana UAMH 10762]|uniref:Uncharacterized protein n=1 Tax=Baudoinia panamericana (strain UAMH 10762) TaxID=717646 RepID=M2MT13_BAUPA|nr:uncharacterized protein BAUCODRAFT_74127 [Baudoinia panamericana UAMH 10762]EMC94663.1 hypothetical protein BAUCODRAFT_74127 [Baudoinia panamericana UAMH 10762]
MPPKRKTQAPSASQPLPEPKQPARTSGRKRRYSDASNVSDRPSSSQSMTAAAPVKRRKKGRPAKFAASSVEPEPEPIVEEEENEEDLEQHHQAMQFGGDATDERMPVMETDDSIQVTHPQSKHVHFGGAVRDADGEDYSTATNITPHPRKTMTMSRRFTFSPSAAASMAKQFITSTLTRTSLPPAMNIDQAANIIKEYHYSPLHTVIEERKRRRLEIESELKEEKNLLANYEDDAEDEEAQQRVIALEQERDELRLELESHLASHRLHVDEQMLVLDTQEDVGYSEMKGESASLQTNGFHGKSRENAEYDLPEITTVTGRASSSLKEMTAAWDKERREFQDAILALNREANDAKAQLQIWRIEAEALGFGPDGASVEVILTSIRESMIAMREKIEAALPDTLPEGATNADIVDILVANLESFSSQLRRQHGEIRDKETVIADLSAQIDGLLEHLTNEKLRSERLQDQWQHLDREHDDKARNIKELEEELETLIAERDDLQKDLTDKVEEGRLMSEDNAQKASDLEKLRLSLDGYILEEGRLTELIRRMEIEHQDQIMKMNREREDTIAEYDGRLETEINMRSEAERLGDERQTTITELEVKIEELATERDTLRDELGAVKAERDAESEGRQQAEASLEEKNVEIEDLETRVSRLEEELDALNTQVDELRRNNETIKTQLASAETDLDERITQISVLDHKLEEQGKQANELRMKLFQVQQENETRVKNLELQMSERDDRFQTDMAAEIERREAADTLAQQRATVIIELEERIEAIELQMRADLASRDERIAALKDELVDVKTDLENEQMDHRAAESTLENEREQNTERVEELNSTILALQETRDELEGRIQELTTEAQNATELHDSEMEDRNAEIARLHATITELNGEVQDLKAEVNSLESRVEQEAANMLDLQNAKEDEIDDLKLQLKEKQEKILVVQQTAAEADAAWTEVYQAKEQELAEMTAKAVAGQEVITTLQSNLVDWKQKFREYAARNNKRISGLAAEVARLQANSQEEVEAERMDGEAVLEEIESFDFEAVVEVRKTASQRSVISSSSQSQSQSSGGATRNTRVSRKSNKFGDSGIGMDGEVESFMVN